MEVQAMLLSIDFTAKQPIYLQIRDGIITGIASGKLKGGDSLPSVRAFAGDIGVNLHTVNKAYRLLQSEGFIQMQRRRGTSIRTDDAAKQTAAFMQDCGESLQAIVDAAVDHHVDPAILHQLIDHLYDERKERRS
jgi:DNA-binding transcriptional regulator YhcF (GntR family)